MPSSTKKATAALAAFAISLPLLATGASWAMKRVLPSSGLLQDQDVSLEKRLPSEWQDASTLKVTQVRTRHEFWAFEKSNVHGAALRLLQTPQLRDALFPGYPSAMYEDEALWRSYFSRDFASTAWLPPLQASSPYGVLLYQSWLGCLDVFKRYGADGIVFGSSETFRTLVPQILSQARGGNERVLLCTTSSSYPQQSEWLAHEMAKPGMPRARWAILGVSLWSFYQDHAAFQSVQSEKKSQWERYLASQYGHYGPDFRTADFFPHLNWDEIFWPNLLTLSKHRGRAKNDEDATRFFAEHPDSDAQGNFTAAEAADPAALQKRLAGFTPTFPLMEGLDGRECSIDNGEKTLGPAVRDVSRIADHVVLYVPPISPKLRATMPPCYLEGAEKTIESYASPRVLIQKETPDEYGLTDADYLYVGEADGVLHYDANHTNYGGAAKVSRRIAERLRAGGVL